MSLVILGSGQAVVTPPPPPPPPPPPGTVIPTLFPSVLQYTAEELISLIRTRAGISSKGEGTRDEDILGYLNAEGLLFVAELLQAHEEYLTVTDRVPLTARTRYPIPHRALFRKLRDAVLVDPSGSPVPIDMVNREDAPWAIASRCGATGIFVESNYVNLAGSYSGGWLDLVYYFRPGQLVMSTACRRVLAVTAGAMTLDAVVPSTWSTLTRFDIHSSNSGGEPKNWSLVAASILGAQVVFQESDVDGSLPFRYPVERGDWVCLEEQAALPGIPREMHPLLAQKVVCRFLEKKDRAAYEVSRNELTYMLKQQIAVLNMRVEGKPEHLSGTHAGSTFFPV